MVRTGLFLGVSLFACASAAAAQEVPVGEVAPDGTAPVQQVGADAPQAVDAQSATLPTGGAGQEIVVTGLRQSLQRAADIKQNAAQIVDSIVSQDIGKFPDPTTAAALQRVPGVQVSVTQSNEIGNVQIRGLGDILTTLDGREIFSTTGRSFSLQDIPADALARVDVIKTNTADLIEGGIAGIIDLQLNKPFDFHKPTVVLNARGNYATNVDKVDPQFGILATDTWNTGIGDIGVLLNATWYKTHYNHPRTREGVRRSASATPYEMEGLLLPNVSEAHSDYGWYERPQANGSIQWQATDALQVYLDGQYSGYRSKSQWSLANAQFFMPGTGITDVQVSEDECILARVRQSGQHPLPITDTHGTADPSDDTPGLQPYTKQTLCKLESATFLNAVTEQKTYSYNNRTDNYLGAFGVKYETDTASAKAEVSYQKSTNKSETVLIALGQRIPEWHYTANDGHGSSNILPGNPLASSQNVVFSEGMDQNFAKSTGDLFAAKLDSSFDIDGIFNKFQVGIRYADRSAEFQQAVVNTPAPGGVIGSDTEGSALLVDEGGLPGNFLSYMPSVSGMNNGDRSLVPNPDFLRSAEGRDMLRALYGIAAGDPDYQPQRRFLAGEKTYAGYAQLSYEVPIGAMTLDGVIGVRPTRTERTISGSSQVSVPATDDTPAHTEIVPVSARTTDTDVLPNASARLQFGGGLQARLSYSKAIRRPDFASLNPGISYSLSTNPNLLNSGSAGNPDLRPQKSENFDASLEYYFPRGFVAVALYKRNITDRVVSAASAEPIDGILYSISRPRNIGAAELKGVEVSGQTFFDFLPGALSGLGAFGNFTYADTKVKGEDRLAGLPLQGVSKYNFNIGALYEKYGISARAVYTYRSRYYDGDETGGLGIRPIDPDRIDDVTYNPLLLNYVRPAGRLDIGISYDITDRIRLDLGGTNVLGNKYRGYFSLPYLGNEYRYDDTTYTAGVRVRL